MKIKNSLTVDYGQIVIVQKDYESVVFESIEDFNHYCPEHAGKLEPWNHPEHYMFYCSDQRHWSDIRDGEHYQTQPEDFRNNSDWEAIISMYWTIKQRQDDIYYGLDESGQIAMARKSVGEMVYGWLRRTDYTLLVDSPFSSEERNLIIDFRQALRSYVSEHSLDELKATTEQQLLEILHPSLRERVSNVDD